MSNAFETEVMDDLYDAVEGPARRARYGNEFEEYDELEEGFDEFEEGFEELDEYEDYAEDYGEDYDEELLDDMEDEAAPMRRPAVPAHRPVCRRLPGTRFVLSGFPHNGHQLTPAQLPATGGPRGLARRIVQSWRTSRPIRAIHIVGHTDSTGSRAYNVGLGRRRANAAGMALRRALAQLINRLRIRSPRGLAMGRPLSQGELCPIAPNSTKAGRARNRRVEFFLVS